MYTQFKKWVLLLLLISMSPIVLSQTTDAGAGIPAPCGMKYDEKTKYLVVESGNYEICPEDLSFQMSYLMFADIYKDEAMRPIVSLFISDEVLNNNFTKHADAVIGVSSGFYFILSAVSIFAWVIITPILALKGYSYVTLVQKSGKIDHGGDKADTIKLMAYLSFLLLLTAPAGLTGGKTGDKYPIMIGQALSVIASLPSYMGGNYIYSTHLAATMVASNTVDVNDELLLPSGQSFSTSLVETELCQERTAGAIFSTNAKPSTPFLDPQFSAGEGTDMDPVNIVDRYNNCLSYVAMAKPDWTGENTNRIDIVSPAYTVGLARDVEGGLIRFDACDDGFFSILSEESYGFAHTCGSIDYETGSESFTETIETNDGSRDMDDVIASVYENYSAKEHFPEYVRNVRADVEKTISSSILTAEGKYTTLEEIFTKYAATNLGNTLVKDTLLSSGNNEQKKLKHLSVSSALLGASVDESFFSVQAAEDLFLSEDTDREDGELSVEPLLRFARGISKDVQAYACAENWKASAGDRQFIYQFNTSDDDNVGDVLEGKTSMRCVDVLHDSTRGDTDKDRFLKYKVTHPLAMSDYKLVDGVYKRDVTQLDNGTYSETALKIKKEFSEPLYQKIQIEKMILSGYTVVVKKAVALSLSENLNVREDDNDRDLELRPKGWAMFGAALLYGGKNQGSAKYTSNGISSTATVNGGTSMLDYINRDAFPDSVFERNPDPKDTSFPFTRSYPNLPVDALFSIGPMGAQKYNGATGVANYGEDDYSLSMVLSIFENLITGPMKHVKAASGMSQSGTLEDGLRECFEGGYESCVSGSKHPIIAMSDFGSELMTNMLVILTVDAVVSNVNALLWNIDRQQRIDGGVGTVDGSGGKEKTGKMTKGLGSKIGSVARMLLKAIGAITAVMAIIFDVIRPIILLLFSAGAVFAFILPMMGYIVSFMMVVMTLASVFAVSVTLPFYVIVKLLHIEEEYKEGFKKFYQDYLGPYLTPMFFGISAVFAWSLIVVVFYALNASMYVIYEGMGVGSGGINGITDFIMYVLMYVVYMVSIFVLFKFSLGVMKSMPDMMKERLGLMKSNEEKYMDSLAFEGFVATAVSQGIADVINKQGQAAKQRHQSDRQEAAAYDGAKSQVKSQYAAEAAETAKAQREAMGDNEGPSPENDAKAPMPQESENPNPNGNNDAQKQNGGPIRDAEIDDGQPSFNDAELTQEDLDADRIKSPSTGKPDDVEGSGGEADSDANDSGDSTPKGRGPSDKQNGPD